MSDSSEAWNGELVCKWLESRVQAARLDQAAADKRGYGARDDYDEAAAEEWVCQSLKAGACTDSQAAFTERLKALLGLDEYRIAGVHDDERVERHVRARLKKLTRMAKANNGFANTSRYQP